MATIRTIFAPGQTLNLLDPNSWVGGVVPGPNDIAQIGENGDYRTAINMSSPYNIYEPPTKNGGSLILPWTESDTTIRVDTNNTNYNSEYIFPDTNGSFLVYLSTPYPRLNFPVKIDYVSKSLDTDDFFYSCSVDTSYGSNWTFKMEPSSYNANITPLGYYSESYGFIGDNNYVYPLETEFELTGSQVWQVGQIETLERCHLTIKENAHLLLDGTTVNPNAIYNNQDSYRNVIRILDNATIETTGSIQRTNAGIYISGMNEYQRFQISGSDLTPTTTLTLNVNAGDSTITVADTTGFGEGSLISIDDAVENTTYFVSSPLSGSNFGLYGGQRSSYYNSTGSYIEQRESSTEITSDIEKNEVVRVVSQSGNNFTVAKRFGKEGEIHQDLGTYNYEQFIQTFGGTASSFEGNKRAILVSSLHRQFKQGDKLIISKSLVTDCLFADYYLSSSILYDYNNSATVENSLHSAPYRLTSSLAIPGQTYQNSSLISADLWNEYFNYENNWVHSFRTGSSGEVTGSLHLRTDNDYINSANNPLTFASSIITQSYFQEGEITINYNFQRDLTGSYDTNTRFSLSYAEQGYAKYGATEAFGAASSYEDGNFFFHSTGYNLYFYQNKTTQMSSRNDKVFGTNTPSNIKLKIVRKNGKEQTFLNDNIINTQYNEYAPSPIKIAGYRYLNIFNIEIKNAYQLLLLDTDQPVSKGEDILEGIGLHYDHPSGQRVKTHSNLVKDPLAFTDLMKFFWTKHGQTDILPYLHGVTTTQLQGTDNYYNYYFFDTSDPIGGSNVHTLPLLKRTLNGATRKAGTGYHEIWDMQHPVSMSALSFQWYNDSDYDYTEMAGENVQIDVSSDLENWTTVYGPTPDPQYSTKMGQRRFYEFTSGSTSAQFVKLYLNGNSRNTTNALSTLGLYNFYDENNQYLGNTIELYNADMFDVGDEVLFSNLKYPEPKIIWGSNEGGGILNWYTNTLPNITNLTDDDVVGGLTPRYTITAKDGNKITLNKPICHLFVSKDTLVTKWNRGGVKLKGTSKSIFKFFVYNFQTIKNPYQWINSTCYKLSPNQSNYFFWACGSLNIQMENNSWENLSAQRNYIGMSNTFKNNAILGGTYFQSTPSVDTNYAQSSQMTLNFNNLVWGSESTLIMNWNSLNFWYTKVINTFNTFYKIYETSILPLWSQPSDADVSRRIHKYPTVKFAHNYVAGTSEDFIMNIARNDKFNIVENIESLQAYDNWMGIGKILRYIHPTFQDPQIGAYQILTNNPNIENIKPYSYLSNTLVDSYNSYFGYPITTDRIGSTDQPFLFDNPIISQPTVFIVPNANSVVGIVKNDEPNKYNLFQNNPSNNTTNAGTRSRSTINLGYKTLFSLDEEQQIQFQLNFDYLTYNYGELGNTVTDNSQINAGYYDENWFFPYLILVDKFYKVIDSVILDSTSNTTFNYDKTFTLPKGQYGFGLRNAGWGSLNSYWREQMIHGPINFNLLSTKPNKASAYYNSWDAYKLFDTPNLYFSTNPGYRGGSGTSPLMRPANSLPIGTIKIHKLKL